MQNLRKAAQQALEYLEQHANISGAPIRDALRAALEPVTTGHELSKEGDKLSLPFNHFPDATKMVATIRPDVTVDTVQSAHIKELYSVDEIREKIESNEYCAELLLQHAMMHLMGNVKPKREPLSDAEIGAVAADIWGSIMIAPQSYQQFARAIIERANGIGE